MLRFIGNVPAAAVILPRYLAYRYTLLEKGSSEEQKAEAEIKIEELVADNPALALPDMIGEKGVDMLTNLASELKNGNAGSIAISLTMIAMVIAGGAGGVKKLARMKRSAAVAERRATPLAERTAGNQSAINTAKAVEKGAGNVSEKAAAIDDAIGTLGVSTLDTGTKTAHMAQHAQQIPSTTDIGVWKVESPEPAANDASAHDNVADLAEARTQKQAEDAVAEQNAMQATGTDNFSTFPRFQGNTGLQRSQGGFWGVKKPKEYANTQNKKQNHLNRMRKWGYDQKEIAIFMRNNAETPQYSMNLFDDDPINQLHDVSRHTQSIEAARNLYQDVPNGKNVKVEYDASYQRAEVWIDNISTPMKNRIEKIQHHTLENGNTYNKVSYYLIDGQFYYLSGSRGNAIKFIKNEKSMQLSNSEKDIQYMKENGLELHWKDFEEGNNQTLNSSEALYNPPKSLTEIPDDGGIILHFKGFSPRVIPKGEMTDADIAQINSHSRMNLSYAFQRKFISSNIPPTTIPDKIYGGIRTVDRKGIDDFNKAEYGDINTPNTERIKHSTGTPPVDIGESTPMTVEAIQALKNQDVYIERNGKLIETSIMKQPDGKIMIYFTENNIPQKKLIDPNNPEEVASVNLFAKGDDRIVEPSKSSSPSQNIPVGTSIPNDAASISDTPRAQMIGVKPENSINTPKVQDIKTAQNQLDTAQENITKYKQEVLEATQNLNKAREQQQDFTTGVEEYSRNPNISPRASLAKPFSFQTEYGGKVEGYIDPTTNKVFIEGKEVNMVNANPRLQTLVKNKLEERGSVDYTTNQLPALENPAKKIKQNPFTPPINSGDGLDPPTLNLGDDIPPTEEIFSNKMISTKAQAVLPGTLASGTVAGRTILWNEEEEETPSPAPPSPQTGANSSTPATTDTPSNTVTPPTQTTQAVAAPSPAAAEAAEIPEQANPTPLDPNAPTHTQADLAPLKDQKDEIIKNTKVTIGGKESTGFAAIRQNYKPGQNHWEAVNTALLDIATKNNIQIPPQYTTTRDQVKYLQSIIFNTEKTPEQYNGKAGPKTLAAFEEYLNKTA